MIRTSKIREISSDDIDSEGTYEATEPEPEPETSSEQAVEVILVPGQAQEVHPDLERLMGLMFFCGNTYPFGRHPNCPIGHTVGDLSISQAEAGDEASVEPEPEPDPTLYEIPAIVINLTTFKRTKHISALDKQLKRLKNKDNINKVIWHRQWSLRPGQRFKRNDQNESKILLMLINHYNRIADELRRRQITDLHINEYDALREVDQGSGTGDMLWQDQFAMLMDKTQGIYLEKLSTSYGSSETTTRLSIACNTFPRLATAFTDLDKAQASDDASTMAGINFEKLQIYYPNLEILKFHFINAIEQQSYAEPFMCLTNVELLVLTFELNEEPTGSMVFKRGDEGGLERVTDEDEAEEALEISVP